MSHVDAASGPFVCAGNLPMVSPIGNSSLGVCRVFHQTYGAGRGGPPSLEVRRLARTLLQLHLSCDFDRDAQEFEQVILGARG